MKAAILSIGNELTLGQTVDTNAAWLSQRLAEIGIPVDMHITIADELPEMVRELRHAAQVADLVLITGGLGPTDDDLTRFAIAEVMGGVELALRDDFLEQIKCFFGIRGKSMPDANRIQAMFPVGSEPIENTCGTAPGIRARINDTRVFAMPGVPREMHVMYDNCILPELAAEQGDAVILAKTLRCYGMGESDIGLKISDLMTRGRNPTVGTTAQQTVIGIRIHASGANHAAANQLLNQTETEIRNRMGSLVFGVDDETLWSAVGSLLIERRRTVATAESCTGGLIAKSLTDLPGSSAYFLQGVVTYSNEAKSSLLGIPMEFIDKHRPVSPEVAEAMARGCLAHSGANYAISVTGIAGPTGGSAEKPVGLVYIGLADATGCEVTRHQIGDTCTREEIRDRTRKIALNRLRLKLISQESA